MNNVRIINELQNDIFIFSQTAWAKRKNLSEQTHISHMSTHGPSPITPTNLLNHNGSKVCTSSCHNNTSYQIHLTWANVFCRDKILLKLEHVKNGGHFEKAYQNK